MESLEFTRNEDIMKSFNIAEDKERDKLKENLNIKDVSNFSGIADEAHRTEEEKKDANLLFSADQSINVNVFDTVLDVKYNSRMNAVNGKFEGEGAEDAKYINDRVYNKYSHRWQKTRKKRLDTSAQKLEKVKVLREELKDDIKLSSTKRIGMYENYYKKINESDRNMAEALAFNENEENLLKKKADSVLVVNLNNIYCNERVHLRGLIQKTVEDSSFNDKLSLVDGTEIQKKEAKDKFIGARVKEVNGFYKDYKTVLEKNVKLVNQARSNKNLVLPEEFPTEESLRKGFEEDILSMANSNEILSASEIKKDSDRIIKNRAKVDFDPLDKEEDIGEFSEILDKDYLEKKR